MCEHRWLKHTPIQLIAMTPILFAGLEALGVGRAVIILIGIRRRSWPRIMHDTIMLFCMPFGGKKKYIM